MAINLQIEPDKKALAEWEKTAKQLGKPEVFKNALRMAINDTLRSANTQGKREISQRFVTKQKNVKDYIKQRRATGGNLSAELTFTGPGIPALSFKAKPTKPAPTKRPMMTLQYKQDGGGAVPGKFVAVMKSGHVGVFERSKDSFMVKHPKRQAINQITGPSAAGMVGSDEVIEAIRGKAQEVLQANIDRQMRRLLYK